MDIIYVVNPVGVGIMAKILASNKLTLTIVVIAALLLWPGAARAALPLAVQRDMLTQQLVAHLEKEQYGPALDVMDQIRALGEELPASLLYFEAKAALATGDPERALKAVEAFLNTPDVKQSPQYKNALTLYSEAEAEVEAKKAEVKRRRTAGEMFKDCDACPEMVVVPAGNFMMGSPASEEGRSENEGPRHRVTMLDAFAVGKYEVTFDEWEACVSDGGCNGYRPKDQGWGRGDRPVIFVNWEDAKSYVAWLSRKTGNSYRLPSESEWEYAARAGTTTPFHFGRTISPDQVNDKGDSSYAGGPTGVYREETVSAGSFPGNTFGLFDVHGNVWEWVEDCPHDSYAGAPSDGSAWTTGSDCSSRIFRGGSWGDPPKNVRAADRNYWTTDKRYHFIGFRVARTLP